jgi:hypothetical protein
VRQKLLIFGALVVPLGLGTLMLFVTHRWTSLGSRYDSFYWLALALGLFCYLALLDSWLKRLLLGTLYLVIMSVGWIFWAITFGCLQFGLCP